MNLTGAAGRHGLAVMGVCAARPEDRLGAGAITLLGPAEPGFWAHVTGEPEFADGAPDPLDRWSAGAIGDVAEAVGGRALLPFGDPPRPFVSWALASGRAWQSPVGLLVHDTQGLMVSYRGAVFVMGGTAKPAAGLAPCATCVGRPCLSACPAGALDGTGYRLDTCHAFLDTRAGRDCMDQGCAVRRACPVSQRYPRRPAQSAYHMAAFHTPSANGTCS